MFYFPDLSTYVVKCFICARSLILLFQIFYFSKNLSDVLKNHLTDVFKYYSDVFKILETPDVLIFEICTKVSYHVMKISRFDFRNIWPSLLCNENLTNHYCICLCCYGIWLHTSQRHDTIVEAISKQECRDGWYDKHRKPIGLGQRYKDYCPNRYHFGRGFSFLFRRDYRELVRSRISDV